MIKNILDLDATRLKDFYDNTYNFLIDCGIDML